MITRKPDWPQTHLMHWIGAIGQKNIDHGYVTFCSGDLGAAL
jgi:hypothetical protein